MPVATTTAIEGEPVSDELLTPREVAAIAKLSERTLANRRSLKTGPPYIKLSDGRSGRVRYPRSGLAAWLRGEYADAAA